MDEKLALRLFRQMTRIRTFEEKLYELFSTRVMFGTMHQCTGQEAIAVGICANLKRQDYITSTHRGHGHCLAKGVDVNAIMAEIFGKTTGCCKGQGGSMHIADRSVGMLGANGIVAAGIPIAVGAGWSSKYKKDGLVSVAFFGDGATSEGAFHEALNLAAVWQLPVVFVCENNLYGFSTHYRRTTLLENISDRAAGYGIPGKSIDGNDIAAVYEAGGEAIDRARRGEGPTLLECKTYRYRGHARFEDANYRSKEEIKDWKENRDPITRFAERLRGKYGIDEAALAEIEKEAWAEMDAAVEFAESGPDPLPLDYQKYIYA